MAPGGDEPSLADAAFAVEAFAAWAAVGIAFAEQVAVASVGNAAEVVADFDQQERQAAVESWDSTSDPGLVVLVFLGSEV